MNAKQSKSLRALARSLVTVEGTQYEEAKVFGDQSTARIRTADNKEKTKVRTVTLRHAEGTFKRIFKDLQADTVTTLIAHGVLEM